VAARRRDRDDAAGLKDAMGLGQRDPGVGQVVEDVEQRDRCEVGIGERELGRVGLVRRLGRARQHRGELSTPIQAPSGKYRASSPSPQPTSGTGVSPSARIRSATIGWTSACGECSRTTERASRKRSGSRS
jgi:hypothetical protein